MPTQPWNLEAKWAALSESLRAEADTLPLGRARDGLLRRADQLDRAIALERSLRSGREEATTFANKVHLEHITPKALEVQTNGRCTQNR